MRFGRVICMSAIATCVAFSALAQGLRVGRHEDLFRLGGSLYDLYRQ
jgi:hypothetical protein